jgi:hypothetical protein
MRPRIIGRALGVGVRVAGRMAGQILEGRPQSAAAVPQLRQAVPVAGSQAQSSNHQNRAAGKTAAHATIQAAQSMGQASHSVSRGVGGFLRPFRRVGGILWLEVMGVFFFLPVVVFAPVLWKTHHSWAQGPDHRAFLIAAVIVAIFLYLSATSFWRAWHR